MHGWLHLIIHNLFPLSTSQNQNLQCHVKYEAVSLNSITKYIGLLTMSVKKKVASAPPDKFALVIDGWTEAKSYYLCVYATFSAHNEIGFESFLLGVTPLSEEDSHSAEVQKETVQFVLDVFEKCKENVVLIGDNCATNRLLANLISCGFVGCASHRYNLAVKD